MPEQYTDSFNEVLTTTNQQPTCFYRMIGTITNQTMNIMIKKTVAAAILAASVVTVHAQTNTITGPNFLQSAEAYFTSFNTNVDENWTNVTLEASTGYKQVTGVNAASYVDVQYDISKFNVGAVFQFSGVGSPINAMEAQFGYDLVEYFDTKLELDIRGGYDWNVRGAIVEPAVMLKKKLTSNTFAEIGVSMPIYSKGSFNQTPTFESGIGFTF
jgi:hypothetical protein